MKKLGLCALLALCLLTLGITALAEITPVLPKGLNYSYKFATASFKADAETAFMDTYMVDLTHKPEKIGEDELYVALNDIASVYAPDFAVEIKDQTVSIAHAGITAALTIGEAEASANGEAVSLAAPVKQENESLYVPFGSLMRECFHQDVQKIEDTEGGWYLTASLTLDAVDTKTFSRSVRVLNNELRGKDYGFQHLTYRIADDESGKILPVRLYVPTSYDPEKPNKAIVLLHGNTVSQNYFFADTNSGVSAYRSIEMFAEESGYILIAPTAYVVAGQYGDVTNIPYMDAKEWVEIDDAEKELRILSEKSVLSAIELAESRLNIDTDHLYLMGNSMGGKGVLFFGNKHADMFRAFVVAGMMPNVSLMSENPYPNLVGRPMIFVEGTEDEYGFCRAKENYELLLNWLPDMQHYWCAGGRHITAWCLSLPQIFQFLNEQI